jgi:23S rRNA (guanosine2251-2'-O)-methyltransferase
VRDERPEFVEPRPIPEFAQPDFERDLDPDIDHEVPDDFQAPGFEAPRFERTRFERPQFDRPRTAGAFGRPERPRFGDGPRDRFGGPMERTRRQGIPIRPAVIADPSLALGDDEELIAGRRPVEEAFVARREAIRLLVVPQRRMALEKLVLHATSLRIPVVEVEGGTLTAVAGFDGHQGIALVVAPRRWAAPDDLLAHALAAGRAPLVLVLDSLEDPQNVGTLLRTAEASGVDGAIFPTRNQAPLTPAAVKASAGAVEHLLLAPVDDLPGALADLHARGLRIVGADGEAQLTAREADLRGPIAIVVGSEGKGLGPAVRRRCDLLIRIPMHGKIESLNASVAGSILLYEAAAQRRLPENPPTAPEAEPEEAVVTAVPAQGSEAPVEDMAALPPAPKHKVVRRKAAPAADVAGAPAAEPAPDDTELLP